MKRLLADTLIELAESIALPADASFPISVTSLHVDLPMEVRLGIRDGNWELFADVPEWRWQTGWEPPLGRLRAHWRTGEHDERDG
jgi:hypothetical protein